MEKQPIYAVVDLETTGTDPENDRIIQFGCSLIENGKIVSQFASDVNPRMKVPRRIEYLTGVKTSQLAKAPYFEDIAWTIHELLADCIFVAHNIYFDYQFLNHELERCGVPALTIAGIDTVELAQIFLPESDGFSLQYLAQSLGIEHDRPHQADSDAWVTAQLFLKIENKIRTLPLVTLELIVKKASVCAMNTGEYLAEIFTSMCQNPPALAEGIHIVNGLALQKTNLSTSSDSWKIDLPSYPMTVEAKKQLFAGKLTYRPEQVQMMDAVYQHFSADLTENKNLAIEAATGTGKSLGYLLPLSYLATPAHPAIISTNSIVLEEQLWIHDIAILNQVTACPVNAVVLKGYHHYIDITRFAETLKHETMPKQYTLYQMKVLVWLTQTQTGDLDELRQTSQQHAFWQDIYHRGPATVAKNSAFSEVDFVVRLHEQIKQANVLIVNHSFLCQETFRDYPHLPSSPYLVLDEAHHLPDTLRRLGTQRFNKHHFHVYLKSLYTDHSDFTGLAVLFEKISLRRHFELLLESLEDLDQDLEFLLDVLFELLLDQIVESSAEIRLDEQWINGCGPDEKKQFQHIFTALADAHYLLEQLQLGVANEQNRWTLSEQLQFSLLSELTNKLQETEQFFQLFLKNWSSSLIKWFNVQRKSQHLTIGNLCIGDLNSPLLAQSSWYDMYEKILFTGSTLKIGNDEAYLQRELGLANLPIVQLANPYNYAEQARLFVPAKSPIVKKLDPKAYATYIARQLFLLIEEQHQPILVLFTSHDLLQQVYQQLQSSISTLDREILAQGVSGSRKKIFKRFMSSKDAVLLGADSFWEGVDLPGEALQLLVVTRLPFESPDRPFVKAKYEYLEKRGYSPFFQEALPKAALRLCQGIGRLIRSESDRGILLVLDNRLVTAKYAGYLQAALPAGLAINEQPFDEILQDIDEFFDRPIN